MQRRILSVQDLSCLGKCSLTVALPILSACGHEACPLPTALLSTHTGGFGSVFKRELTEDMPDICSRWLQNGISFHAVCSGYLGNERQIHLVQRVFESLVAPGGKRIVDPAMADHGRLYTGFAPSFVAEMKKLCTAADMIVPNVTEACLLTGMPYRDHVDERFFLELLERLGQICPCVVLTGAAYEPGMTGVAVLENGKIWHYPHEQIPGNYAGTGDIFLAALVGAWQRGKSLREAVRIGAQYTLRSIALTAAAPTSYGVRFEAALPDLMKMLG